MPTRKQIVDYTAAVLVDVLDPDGIWRAQVGYITRPAIVVSDEGAAGCTLCVFGEPLEGERDGIVSGVQQGPAAPDTKQGRRVDPSAVVGAVGTWS